MLNPKATPYEPLPKAVAQPVVNRHAPRFQPAYTDEQSLFLTFSNGFPLTERELFDFFNWYFYPDVETVIVPRAKGGRGPSLHGRVVFSNTYIPEIVMRNCNKVGFSINERPFYCRRFVSKKTNTEATASTSHRDGGSHSGGGEE